MEMEPTEHAAPTATVALLRGDGSLRVRVRVGSGSPGSSEEVVSACEGVVRGRPYLWVATAAPGTARLYALDTGARPRVARALRLPRLPPVTAMAPLGPAAPVAALALGTRACHLFLLNADFDDAWPSHGAALGELVADTAALWAASDERRAGLLRLGAREGEGAPLPQGLVAPDAEGLPAMAMATAPPEMSVTCVAPMPELGALALGLSSGAFQLWSCATWRPVYGRPLEGAAACPVTALRCHVLEGPAGAAGAAQPRHLVWCVSGCSDGGVPVVALVELLLRAPGADVRALDDVRVLSDCSPCAFPCRLLSCSCLCAPARALSPLARRYAVFAGEGQLTPHGPLHEAFLAVVDLSRALRPQWVLLRALAPDAAHVKAVWVDEARVADDRAADADERPAAFPSLTCRVLCTDALSDVDFVSPKDAALRALVDAGPLALLDPAPFAAHPVAALALGTRACHLFLLNADFDDAWPSHGAALGELVADTAALWAASDERRAGLLRLGAREGEGAPLPQGLVAPDAEGLPAMAMATAPPEMSVTCVAPMPELGALALGLSSGAFQLWSCATWRPVYGRPLEGAAACPVTALRCHVLEGPAGAAGAAQPRHLVWCVSGCSDGGVPVVALVELLLRAPGADVRALDDVRVLSDCSPCAFPCRLLSCSCLCAPARALSPLARRYAVFAGEGQLTPHGPLHEAFLAVVDLSRALRPQWVLLRALAPDAAHVKAVWVDEARVADDRAADADERPAAFPSLTCRVLCTDALSDVDFVSPKDAALRALVDAGPLALLDPAPFAAQCRQAGLVADPQPLQPPAEQSAGASTGALARSTKQQALNVLLDVLFRNGLYASITEFVVCPSDRLCAPAGSAFAMEDTPYLLANPRDVLVWAQATAQRVRGALLRAVDAFCVVGGRPLPDDERLRLQNELSDLYVSLDQLSAIYVALLQREDSSEESRAALEQQENDIALLSHYAVAAAWFLRERLLPEDPGAAAHLEGVARRVQEQRAQRRPRW
eukprot:m51a1_g13064 hypothetical protein (1009) ;mRNA; f:599-4123